MTEKDSRGGREKREKVRDKMNTSAMKRVMTSSK